MQCSQLACPHCGSTLNFSVEIVEGASVECLICMQAFTATNVVVIAGSPAPQRTPAAIPFEMPTEDETMPSDGAPDTVEFVPAAAMETMHDGMQDIVPGEVAVISPEEIVEDAFPVAMEPVEQVDVVELIESPIVAAPEPILALEIADEPVRVSEPPVAPTPSKKRAPKGEVLVAKPYSAPTGTAFAPKPAAPAPSQAYKSNPAFAAPSAARPHHEDESAVGGKVVLAIAACGLLFLLTGGIVFAAWKATIAARVRPTEPETPTLAAAGSSKSGPSNLDPKKGAKPAVVEEDEDEVKGKIDEEVKQVLRRKNAAKPGVLEFGPDPIPALPGNQPTEISPQQLKINKAIDNGVKYLRRTQLANGTWHHGHGVGYAAIGGLTLLECNTPADDQAVQRAAVYVRRNTGNLNLTYELSLAILFLDRLGDPRDRPLIQGMALRLLAGQNDCGGWTYTCKQLGSQEMFQLYNFLQSHKQPNLLDPLGGGGIKTQSGIAINPTRDPANLNNPFYQLNELILTRGIDGANLPVKPDPKNPGLIPPGGDTPPKGKPDPIKPAVKPISPASLPATLQNLPIVKNQGFKKGQAKTRQGGGDNSNTQFAMLALWAARRHDVPTDQALLTSYQRFMTSQNGDGSWGYRPGTAHNPNTMTNVGLLGLAMGHGAAPELINFNPKNPKNVVIKPALEDPTIRKGLQALSRYIGQPSANPDKTSFPMENLYFLWSVERVAMLYDLKTIGGKDWYGWGSQILVHNQHAGGEWPSSFYHGSTPPLNTCFALLFLRRSNLVQDLTNNLRLNTGIVDPEK